MGKLILVGAGPGDPELITVKGLNAVRKADVILYDALANPEILKQSPESCQKVFVGKRGYKKAASQEHINQMCVEYANDHEIVVRLKGGDPFVFGRGQEEVLYARQHNIEVEVVPGLSSATSLATLLGIPLTLRDVTRGFAVVSAVDKNGNLTQELRDGVSSNMTIVVLMGLKRIHDIVCLYKDAFKSDVPIIVIANGSLPNQETAAGTMENIESIIQKEELTSPATLIIGEVVNSFQQDVK